MNERVKKALQLAGYPLFFIVCFGVFASLTFPYDKLKERIVASFNEEQRRAGLQQELRIDELTSSWVTGVKMRGVRLVSPPSEPNQPPIELRIDDARVRFAILPLLIGHQNVSFRLHIGAGEVTGEVSTAGKDRAIDVTLDAVPIGQVGPIVQAVGLPMEGTLSGTVTLTFPDGKASKGNGTVALDGRELTIGDGKAKLKGPVALALPKISAGTLTVLAEAKDGVLKISKLSASGRDLDVQGDGRVQMRELATESLCDLSVRFKINDAYRTRSEVTTTLFGAPGSVAPPLFEMDPKVRQAKRPDGFYAWHVRGPLGRPEFEPASAPRL